MTRKNLNDEQVNNILSDGWELHSINIIPYTNMTNGISKNSVVKEFYFIKNDVELELKEDIFKSAIKELIQISEYKKNEQ